jgi:hypothetical protein
MYGVREAFQCAHVIVHGDIADDIEEAECLEAFNRRAGRGVYGGCGIPSIVQ